MYCPKCGTSIPEGDKFCPNCGNAVDNPQMPVTIDDHTAEFDAKDIERTKYLSAICYIGVLMMILALVIEPDSKFIRYHVNQSLLIAVLSIICAVICIIPVVGWLVGLIGSIAAIVFTIMGISRALHGKAEDIPFIGKYLVVHYD